MFLRKSAFGGLSSLALVLAGCASATGTHNSRTPAAAHPPPAPALKPDPAAPRNAAEVNALLRKTVEKYRALNSCSATFTAQRDNGGQDHSIVTGKLFFCKPNLIRLDTTATYHDSKTGKVTFVVAATVVSDGKFLVVSSSRDKKTYLRLPAPVTPEELRQTSVRIPFWQVTAHLILGDKLLLDLLPKSPMGAQTHPEFAALHITQPPTWRPAQIDGTPVTRAHFVREDFDNRTGQGGALKYGYYQNFHLTSDGTIRRFESTQFYGGTKDRTKVDYSSIQFNPAIPRSTFVFTPPPGAVPTAK